MRSEVCYTKAGNYREDMDCMDEVDSMDGSANRIGILL